MVRPRARSGSARCAAPTRATIAPCASSRRTAEDCARDGSWTTLGDALRLARDGAFARRDVYVVADDVAFTRVHTHEEAGSLALGPYFRRR